MQCGFGRDLMFGFPGFEDYEIHATPSFSKVTMETTYFQHEKQLFRNYNHDFRKEEIIWHKTNDVLFCYTFGWGNSYFKPLFEEWPQHYKFLLSMSQEQTYLGLMSTFNYALNLRY